jgi:N-acetyl-gamma-glutamyl-phosphate reductase
MEFKVFIDGEAGTTGLKVAERLQAHPHVQILRVDDAERKNAAARVDMMAASEVTPIGFTGLPNYSPVNVTPLPMGN